MSRALVLGGGGPVGIAWETGLTVGFAGEGIRLADADLIVGTSAGSVVGAQLALGLDPSDTVEQIGSPLPLAPGGEAGVAGLLEAMASAAAPGNSPEEALRVLGRLSLESSTVDEETFLGAFELVGQHEWPAGYACTAIEVHTGEFTVWDSNSGIPLQRGVASSCAVPGVFPPITIGEGRYMDGGMRTALNADVAVGHDAVIVVSCFALALPDGMSDPTFDAMKAQIDAELARLRDSGAELGIIAPGAEFLDISGWGLNLMDPSLVADAYAAGVRQAAVEAEAVRAVWKP